MTPDSLDSPITLHVVYVKGTTQALSLGALSLARFTQFRLRLVSNGCTEAEEAFLEGLCESNSRLSFLRLPREAQRKRRNGAFAPRAEHCDAIAYLYRTERSPFFGFVDSDIFAVGAMSPAVPPDAGELISAMPLTAAWSRRHERHLAAKNAVGSSFLAVYHGATLRRLMERSGVGFERYVWEKVPDEIKSRLRRAGYARRKFDTGKLLNTLLALEGGAVRWVDDANLRHLGGFSHPAAPVPSPRSWGELPGFVASKLRRHVQDYRRVGFLREGNRANRNACAEYFAALLASLDAGGAPPPPPRVRNGYVRAKLIRMGEELRRLHPRVVDRPATALDATLRAAKSDSGLQRRSAGRSRA